MPMEGRCLSSRSTHQVKQVEGLGNLQTSESIQSVRTALHTKAKEEPKFRFYLLYEKIYRADILLHAYRSCKANKGAAGVDDFDFEAIEEYGEEQWPGEPAERLKKYWDRIFPSIP